MKHLADVNLLLYAHHQRYEQHPKAAAWLNERLTHEGLALPWAVVLGFVRMSVNPRQFERPMSLERAWQAVEALLETQRVWLVEPSAYHARTLSSLLPLCRPDGADIADGHLAALAMEHRLTLCTADRGFARFETMGLRWLNPLES